MTTHSKLALNEAGMALAWFLAAFAVFGPLVFAPGCATGSAPAPAAAASISTEIPDAWVARIVPMAIFPATSDCGPKPWFTVAWLTTASVGIRMDGHSHVFDPIAGYWFGLGPWQSSATWAAWPHKPGELPPGWTIGNLGWLPGDLPWHLKLTEVAAIPDQNGDGYPEPMVVGCAEVSFQIPKGGLR